MLADLAIDDTLAAHFFSRLRLMGYGGATLPDDLYRRLQALAVQHTGSRIVMVTGWGCTETAPTAKSFTLRRTGPAPGSSASRASCGTSQGRVMRIAALRIAPATSAAC
jgi:feruloyl-CoA synthase